LLITPDFYKLISDELVNLVKNFFDKQIGSLPKKEEEGEYSFDEKSLMNNYTWENLENKIQLLCYFRKKDITDEFTFNDMDYLEIKIFQIVK
jgi:hypothetical protein